MANPCDHSHAETPGLSGAGLARELSAARARCKARGERMTSSRERVLELLLLAGAPVKAYDLMADFDPSGAPAKPPTVYRALEFLEREGFAHRIASLNAFVACRVEGGHEAGFLICDCCGAASEIEPETTKALVGHASRDGFAVASVVLEAHGLCADCQEGAKG